ncbi:MAG: methylmalonyl-CoA mutase family protein, partial [Caulobacteraceae bacterium]
MATDSPPHIALAAGFAAADAAAWTALAEKTLKGAPLESLTRRTLEGLPIRPLYEPAADLAPIARTEPGWDVRSPVRAHRPAKAADEATAALRDGAQSLLLAIGPTGLAAASEDDVARALEGVVLDAAPVALEAGFAGPQAADWLAAAAKGSPAAPLAFHLDPLSAFAEAGASAGPIEAHLIAAATVAARLAEPYPRASLFLASGRFAHEAGAGEALEVALALASAVAYAKALTRAGLAMPEAFARVVLGLAIDADAFLSIAKLRAARRAWARLATACGAGATARIEARSSARMLTRADPWTNMI